MIRRLHGTVVEINTTLLVVDVHGVGYAVHCTEKLASLCKLNETILLFIHTHVREDTLDLYGFREQQELLLFEQLLTVSGIGPRIASSIIERGAAATENAVRTSDVDFFTTIPRLGKKNAQKIIIELKNKLGGLKELDLTGTGSGETKQIVEALTGMGFGRPEVIEAIKKLESDDVTIEQKIRHILKLLAK